MEPTQTWSSFRTANPNVRIREAAKQIGVSEAALLATELGRGVTRLRCEPVALCLAWPSLGEVKAITRNEHCVSECIGPVPPPEVDPHGGQVVGEIDLRLFFHAWKEAFLVREPVKDGTRTSVQVFDGHGPRHHVEHIARDVVGVEPGPFPHGLTEAECALHLGCAGLHVKYAIDRNSMLSRGRASGRLVSRNAVCGTRQGRTRRLSWNVTSRTSSRVMFEKYHQRCAGL